MAAFAGGFVLKGKSGWCSSLCPLLPVQRMYGQSPFANVPNSHCRPCLGCTKNCFDFNPKVAYLADLHDGDRQWSTTRKLFTAAFPGLVIAFFTDQDATVMALAIGAAAGSFLALEALLPASTPKLAAVYAAAAINLFYRRACAGPDRGGLAAARGGSRTHGCLAVADVRQGARVPRAPGPARPAACRTARACDARALSAAPRSKVIFEDGPRIVARPGTPLLELAETAEQPIEAGCRMGVCGADPVQVVSGMESLSPVGSDEQATLERLGLDPAHNRMACCARIAGSDPPVTVSMTPRRDSNVVVSIDFPYDPAVQRIVVIGNGIAVVTAADHVRRRHPGCAVDVVAAEPGTPSTTAWASRG